MDASFCPDCGFAGDFKVLKPQKQETVDADHSFKITKLQCENCACHFDAIERTELSYEIIKHGHSGKMLGVSMTPSERDEFENRLLDLQKLLGKIFGSSSGDTELMTILHNELQEAIMITGNFSRNLKTKSIESKAPE